MDYIVPTFNYYGQHLRRDIWVKVRAFPPGNSEGIPTVKPASFEAVKQAIIAKHHNRHSLTLELLDFLGADRAGPIFDTFLQTHESNMRQEIQIELTAAYSVFTQYFSFQYEELPSLFVLPEDRDPPAILRAEAVLKFDYLFLR
jgi:hypothetical protein